MTTNQSVPRRPTFDPATASLDPALDQRLEPLGSRILILTAVRLTHSWRGFGLGALVAETALQKLSAGARAAVCHPASLADTGGDHNIDTLGEASRDMAVAILSQVWERLRFERFRHGVYVLDLSLVTLHDNLRRLAKLAEGYRTVG